MGWGDDSPMLKNNPYKNPFWNETAFFKSNKDRPFRVEVNWKGAYQEAERAEWRGDKMSFYILRLEIRVIRWSKFPMLKVKMMLVLNIP